MDSIEREQLPPTAGAAALGEARSAVSSAQAEVDRLKGEEDKAHGLAAAAQCRAELHPEDESRRAEAERLRGEEGKAHTAWAAAVASLNAKTKRLAELSKAEAEKRGEAERAERKRLEDEARSTEERQRREMCASAGERLEAGGFTRKAAPHDFDNLCRAYADARERRAGLLLVGGTGRGKTTAAKALAPYALFINAVTDDLATLAEDGARAALFENRRRNREGWGEYWKWREECAGAWIIDDLGAEATARTYGEIHEYAGELLYALCEAGQAGFRGVPIITTNYAESRLAERYGPRILSRLRGCFVFVSFSGGDHRQKLPIYS